MGKRHAVLIALSLNGLVSAQKIPVFQPPSSAAQKAALGDISGLSESWQRALDPARFEPVPLPQEGDWLARRQEFPQALVHYALTRRPKITRGRRTIYLLPMGSDIEADRYVPFLTAYFWMRVEILPAEPLGGREVLAAERVLGFLRTRVPDDAFALVAITSADLHPGHQVPADRGGTFLFGRARFSGANAPPRVAVVSTARLEGSFLRTAKLLAHETGHLFGLAHCVYYRCAMNGSAHLREADARPVHLCPVCLRKLGTAVRFDPERRYDKLADVYGGGGYTEDAAWVRGREGCATAGSP